MSFLLTEVALEMMGFKFYDLNGVCMGMNFQERNPVSNPELADEPNLAEILGVPKPDIISTGPIITETVEIDDDDDEDELPHATQTVREVSLSETDAAAEITTTELIARGPIRVIASAKVNIDDPSIVEVQNPPNRQGSQVSLLQLNHSPKINTSNKTEPVSKGTILKISENFVETLKINNDVPEWLYLPENLSRSISYEYNKLHQEIMYKKKDYLNIKQNIKEGRLTTENVNKIRKEFIKQEIRNIISESNTIRLFRNIIEIYMHKAHPKMYQDYLNMCQENNHIFEADLLPISDGVEIVNENEGEVGVSLGCDESISLQLLNPPDIGIGTAAAITTASINFVQTTMAIDNLSVVQTPNLPTSSLSQEAIL